MELLDGLILEMPPEGTEHTYFEENLAKRLERLAEGRAYVRENKPITLSNSEPEPNIVIAKLPRSQYLDHHPFPTDILLLVEVSKSTLERDTSVKKKIYARENIPDYWVVDVANRKLIVYRSPGSGDYEQRAELSSTEKISPLAFFDIEIAIGQIFSV
ncbi:MULTISPECIES: Uma2 family endonuclease [unclassified Coleofasciculus]|uniref:Uma2 family endonuclease n=1 Tax=unclassified Coleofasciculus TaxID=2692782 RepID=UPI0018816B68|nr:MULTISPECIES: Uma2 family endonuclease [unclassified Coleofasciculus]MBE9128749.1 Uma2 family endonuclease [Coleofasciculus sp. LEGE 07081]MBE9150851.1 Uma2 family endonuclease [Coleofasciculus sp. LEGE 07092]